MRSSTPLAKPRRRFTAAQRAQSHAFWARKQAKAARATAETEARRRRQEDERHAKNAGVLRSVAVNPALEDEVLRRSQEGLRAELAALRGPSAPPPSSREQARALKIFNKNLAARPPAPQKLGTRPSLSEPELLAITREAADSSDQRLRSFANYRRALDSVPSRHEIDAAKEQADAASASFKPLDAQHRLLATGKSGRKKTRLRLTKKAYEEAARESESAQAHHASLTERRNLVQAIRDSKSDEDRAAEDKAARLWVHDEGKQSVNVRTLSNWGKDGVPWLARNRAAGREPVPGEYLNVDKGWTDYVNQGWMQGGYDRGAAFRLLTHVPKEVAMMHNQHAGTSSTASADAYDKQLKAWAGKHRDTHRWFWAPGPTPGSDEGARKSYFAQELVDAAGAGYAIHKDQGGGQALMPRARSQLLKEVRARADAGTRI